MAKRLLENYQNPSKWVYVKNNDSILVYDTPEGITLAYFCEEFPPADEIKVRSLLEFIFDKPIPDFNVKTLYAIPRDGDQLITISINLDGYDVNDDQCEKYQYKWMPVNEFEYMASDNIVGNRLAKLYTKSLGELNYV